MPATRHFRLYFEIPLIFLFFAFMLCDSVNTNLIMYRTCYATLGYNKTECALLGSSDANNETNNLEKKVQPYATVVNSVHTFVQQICAAIFCLFVGPWSDRFGRRPMLLIPVFGFVVNYLTLAIFAAFQDLSPWYYLVTSIPVIATGGSATYLTVLLCYITDITDDSNRGFRMGTFEAFLTLGTFLGNISSSYVYSVTNYPAVFLIAGACCFINFIITYLFIPESLAQPESESGFKQLFKFINIKDMVKTTFKKRQNNQRYTVITIVIMLTILITNTNGDGSVVFFYLRGKFNWSLGNYTLYTGVCNVITISGTIIVVAFLHKLMKVPETLLILIGFTSLLVAALIMGLAKNNWEIYTAAACRILSGGLNPMARSLVSKIVPNEEAGRIFALMVASESLIGTAGSPIYTAIYNGTIQTDSSIYNFISASVYLLEILFAIEIIVMRPLRKTNEDMYDHIPNGQNSEPQQEVNHDTFTM